MWYSLLTSWRIRKQPVLHNQAGLFQNLPRLALSDLLPPVRQLLKILKLPKLLPLPGEQAHIIRACEGCFRSKP